MDADRVGRSLARIAHEILERNRGLEELALIGIRTRGVPIARRLAQLIHDVSHADVPTGALDITLYRDDLMRHAVGAQPLIRKTEIPFSIDDRRILLVDDVLYTGRTIRAALDALIERGHAERAGGRLQRPERRNTRRHRAEHRSDGAGHDRAAPRLVRRRTSPVAHLSLADHQRR